jgi:hypothetical protein
MWNGENAHALLVGVQNVLMILETDLAVIYKIEHTLTMQPSNPIPVYLPKINGNECPQRPLCEYCWKQLKRSSLGRWIYRFWYTSTLEPCLAIELSVDADNKMVESQKKTKTQNG